MSPDVGFFIKNVLFVSAAFCQAQGMGKVQFPGTGKGKRGAPAG